MESRRILWSSPHDSVGKSERAMEERSLLSTPSEPETNTPLKGNDQLPSGPDIRNRASRKKLPVSWLVFTRLCTLSFPPDSSWSPVGLKAKHVTPPLWPLRTLTALGSTQGSEVNSLFSHSAIVKSSEGSNTGLKLQHWGRGCENILFGWKEWNALCHAVTGR